MLENIIVTGYVDLHSKESRFNTKQIDTYCSNAFPLLNSGKKIFFFCEGNYVDLFYKIIKNENKKNVEIVPIDFMHLSKSFYDINVDLPAVRNINKDTFLYMMLIQQKIKWLKSVAENFKNHFFYTWIDLGINHVLNLDNDSYANKLNSITYKKNRIIIPRLKRFFFKNKNTSLEILNNFSYCFLAGGIITSPYEELIWLDKKQTELIEHIYQKYHLVSWEASYWSIIYNQYPDKFYTYYSKWNQTLLMNHPSN